MNSELWTDLMTDKELLTFAAKAAGYAIQFKYKPGGYYIPRAQIQTTLDYWSWWSPLTDDGDAMRLAVQLRIGLHHGNDDDVMAVTYDLSAVFTEKFGNDPYSSTRRAIVRAAAEIGKVMR